MAYNVNWFTQDVEEAWAYGGRLYRSEAKAMQEYNYRINRLKHYIGRLENGTMQSSGTTEEAIASYVKLIEEEPKPRKFKVQWEDS